MASWPPLKPQEAAVPLCSRLPLFGRDWNSVCPGGWAKTTRLEGEKQSVLALGFTRCTTADRFLFLLWHLLHASYHKMWHQSANVRRRWLSIQNKTSWLNTCNDEPRPSSHRWRRQFMTFAEAADGVQRCSRCHLSCSHFSWRWDARQYSHLESTSNTCSTP